ncbi:MAG: sigma-70 family RNA polymerase sigma factor [Thermoguttaceae bacterium]
MATLQARLARGEPAAFAELHDACADRVGHYLLVRLGSWADAEDALQETFVRLARAKEKFASVENLEAYVIAIARNEAARSAVRRAKHQQREQPLLAEELFGYDPADADARENAEMVAAALGRLQPDLQEVVELKVFAGLTFQQISQVTGPPQGTAATRYRSALAKMRAWFARQPQ